MFDARGTQHVVYTGVDNHIYERFRNRDAGWSYSDLTYVARQVAAAANRPAPDWCFGYASAYAYPADGECFSSVRAWSIWSKA